MRVGGGAVISAAAFASLTIRVIAGRGQVAERPGEPALGAGRPPPAVAVARIVTLLGSRPVVYAVAAAADAIAVRERSRPPRALALVTSGMVTRKLVADLVARPRPSPERWLVRPGGYSYPSRHNRGGPGLRRPRPIAPPRKPEKHAPRRHHPGRRRGRQPRLPGRALGQRRRRGLAARRRLAGGRGAARSRITRPAWRRRRQNRGRAANGPYRGG